MKLSVASYGVSPFEAENDRSKSLSKSKSNRATRPIDPDLDLDNDFDFDWSCRLGTIYYTISAPTQCVTPQQAAGNSAS